MCALVHSSSCSARHIAPGTTHTSLACRGGGAGAPQLRVKTITDWRVNTYGYGNYDDPNMDDAAKEEEALEPTVYSSTAVLHNGTDSHCYYLMDVQVPSGVLKMELQQLSVAGTHRMSVTAMTPAEEVFASTWNGDAAAASPAPSPSPSSASASQDDEDGADVPETRRRGVRGAAARLTDDMAEPAAADRALAAIGRAVGPVPCSAEPGDQLMVSGAASTLVRATGVYITSKSQPALPAGSTAADTTSYKVRVYRDDRETGTTSAAKVVMRNPEEAPDWAYANSAHSQATLASVAACLAAMAPAVALLWN